MEQTQCAKCGSMVAVSKAFCPECANPMVAEEVRKVEAEFDQVPATVQFSSSDFDILKQKMDLDISEPAADSEQAAAELVPEESAPTREAKDVTETPKSRNPTLWFKVLALVFAFVLFLAVVLGIFLYILS